MFNAVAQIVNDVAIFAWVLTFWHFCIQYANFSPKPKVTSGFNGNMSGLSIGLNVMSAKPKSKTLFANLFGLWLRTARFQPHTIANIG